VLIFLIAPEIEYGNCFAASIAHAPEFLHEFPGNGQKPPMRRLSHGETKAPLPRLEKQPHRDIMHQLLLYLKLVTTAVIWGGTFVAGRIIAREVGPFSAAFLRFVVASFFLLLFVLKSYGKIPALKKQQVVPVLLLGVTGIFCYNVLFFYGLKTVTASRASLIIAGNPVVLALLSAWLFRERLSPVNILGIVLSVSGAVTVISHGNPWEIFQGHLGLGELYIFGCVLSWVAYSLVGKIVLKNLPPLIAVTYACLIGAACLFPPAALEGVIRTAMHYSNEIWLSIFYLGFFGSALGFVWYYEGIRTLGPSRAGVFINIVPVSSIVLAFLILQETLEASLLMGALLVTVGVYFTNRPANAARS
jgi:drug/metabolite transporter (DMT)-like permease